jgi:hypothetical protein
MYLIGYDFAIGNAFLQQLFVRLFKFFTICRLFRHLESPRVALKKNSAKLWTLAKQGGGGGSTREVDCLNHVF